MLIAEGLVGLLLTLVVIALLVWLALYVIDRVLTGTPRDIARAVVLVIAAIWLISTLYAVFVGGVDLPRVRALP
jgi:hypothetical protein